MDLFLSCSVLFSCFFTFLFVNLPPMTIFETNNKTPLLTTYIDNSSSPKRYWQELKEFRELIYFLSWRDILVRYKQTAIGIVWAVLKPLLLMTVLTLVFGRFVRLSEQSIVPYPLLVLSALVPWLFFANTLAESVESVVRNQNLISKIFFPRMIIPISANIVTLLDFCISLTLLGIAMIYYGYLPGFNFIFLPCFMLILFTLSFGISLWVSALTVRYRDFRYIIPFFLQFGLYITPVGFSSSLVPDYLRAWYSLNPMVGIIDGFRWALLGQSTLYWPALFSSLVISLFIFSSGMYYFRKVERNFADII